MKYLADTNLVSEVMKRRPDRRVSAWFERHDAEIGLPALVLAELADGAAKHPDEGRRRELLDEVRAIAAQFDERIIPFASEAALVWGELKVSAAAKRLPAPLFDSLIEATALAQGLAIATRNARDFRQAATVNPCES